jgi:hypothetical protein
MTSVKYITAAGLLGAGWFVVLQIPPTTRGWLYTSPAGWLFALVVASILTALWLRSYIVRANTRGEHLARAVVIPYVGTLLFLAICVLDFLVRGALGGEGLNFRDATSIVVMGFVAVSLSLYVVIPYGLLCQIVMKRVAEGKFP